MKYDSKATGTSSIKFHTDKHEERLNTPLITNFLMKPPKSIEEAVTAEILESCVDVVASDLRPFSMFHCDGFENFILTVWNCAIRHGEAITPDQVHQMLPSRQTVGRHVKKNGRESMENIRKLLNKVIKVTKMAFTTDLLHTQTQANIHLYYVPNLNLKNLQCTN